MQNNKTHLQNGPLVSVIVPAYNHEKYVVDCLEGIASQSYQNIQWIVVDDCSNDKTPQILRENQTRYGYQLILHKENKGLSATLTEAIKDYSKGSFIVICASDDVFLPNKIESQLSFLQENPQYVMCYSPSIYIDSNSNVIPMKEDIRCYRSGYIFEEVLCRKFFMGINTMYRSKVFEEVGYYEPGIMAEDYYLYSKIAQKYEIGFLNECSLQYRVVEISKKRDPWKLVLSHKQTLDMYKEDELYSKAVRAWEVQSAMIIALTPKYKLIAFKYVIKNFWYFVCHPLDFLRVSKYLVFIWK